MSTVQTIKGHLTSHWWIVAIFLIVAIVVVFLIYSELNKNSNDNPTIINLTTPANARITNSPANTTGGGNGWSASNPTGFYAPAWTVSSGALPTNDNQAQLVLLDPSATQAQIDAANAIEAMANSGLAPGQTF
jgi:hypothetical protein